MRRYSYLIFDCDGTLLNSKSATQNSFRKLVKFLKNRELSNSELIEAFHSPVNGIMESLGIPNTNENMTLLEKFYVEEKKYVLLYDGVVETLKKLKEMGLKMSMATNRDEKTTIEIIKETALYPYLEGFTCVDYVLNPKPSGDMLNDLIERFNYKRDETLFLGNAISDHLAAMDAGIDYAYCMWGTDDTLDEDAHRIEDMREILKLLGE